MQLNKNTNWSIFIIAFIVFAIWQSPSLGIIRYPFILLGTWFHEMGHGITSLILGGNFKLLKIFDNGGGVAHVSYTNKILPLHITGALISAGGLLGPCIMGALLIISASNNKATLWMLRLLILSIIVSVIIWVRSATGIAVLTGIAIILASILYIKNIKLTTWTVLFLGLQSTLSTYLQLDYLFTSSFIRDGTTKISDTQSIANNLFGTYWFWAIVIIFFSSYLLWKSYRYYLQKTL